MKQDFAELRYKGRIIKIDICYDENTEDIIPLYQVHDLIAIKQNNRNKKATFKSKVNPKTNNQEIYLSSFIEEPLINKKEKNEKSKRNS